jgi:hypothetical protein
MSWNYRIVCWGRGQYDIREVYYDENGKPLGWTANPRELTGESRKAIIEDLELMLESVRRHPVLKFAENKRTNLRKEEA